MAVIYAKRKPLAYVKDLRQANKNDAADAETICKAVTRPLDAARAGEVY
jgi:transposase